MARLREWGPRPDDDVPRVLTNAYRFAAVYGDRVRVDDFRHMSNTPEDEARAMWRLVKSHSLMTAVRLAWLDEWTIADARNDGHRAELIEILNELTKESPND